MKDLQIIVLAAGRGRRMENSVLPKVLLPLGGRSLISHVLSAVRESGLDVSPAVVVGQEGREILAALGPDLQYIYQREPLGTCQAALSAKGLLSQVSRQVMILPGDHPFISADLLRSLASSHISSGEAVTLATAAMQDFENPLAFSAFDRVARSGAGAIIKLLPAEVLQGSEEVWPEVSPGYFCFQASWFWPSLYRLGYYKSDKESRLSDLVNLAVNERKVINEMSIRPAEALGVDTLEQLRYLEQRLGASAGFNQ